jgi:predicted translin family RNA/ssDNA-binding protein
MRLPVDRAAQSSGRCRSPIASEKLHHVVPKAYQIPLRTHLTQTAQQELSEAAALLDLAKDRFTDPLRFA